MANLYRVQNGSMTTTAPLAPVTTSATLYTLLQVVGAVPMKIVEWGVSFNGSALATAFGCDLVDTGTIPATVTAYTAGDVMVYSDANAPANSAGTTGTPLNLGTSLSGFTSSAEGTATSNHVFDSQQIEPIGGFWKQFPLGREPEAGVGNVVRIRVKGDGATKAYAYLVFEV